MTHDNSFPTHCDIGGDYLERHDRPAIYREPCPQPPTHRYRTAGMVEGFWGGRCSQHAAWLDRSICTVEPLAVIR
jgi:hypothetical protein